MIAEAKDIVASSVIDINHNNNVVFADYIIQIPQKIQVDFDSEDYITLHNCSVDISVGDTFAVYVNNFPCCYKAVSVKKEGADIEIQIADADDGAILDMDYQGCIDVDLSTFVPDEGSTYVLNGEIVTESPTERNISYDGKTLRADKKITFADGMSVSVSVIAKNFQINHNINLLGREAYVTVSGDVDYSCNVKCDGWSAIGFSHTLELGSVTIFGIGKVALELEYDMSGEVSLTWKTYTEAGFAYYDGCFRLVTDIQKKSFTFAANMNLTAGLRLSAKVDLAAVKASIYATVGAKMNFNHISYETGKPSSCQSMNSFMYANVGADASINFLIYKDSWSAQYDIWSLRNSPVRVSYHYEDGRLVNRCTRYDEFVSKGGNNIQYLTSTTSRYFNPMGVSGYEGADGSTVPIYEYCLNSEDEATITKYHGGAAAVNIPSELDGHKVVAIGDSAFLGNKALRTVMIPDSVMIIGYEAFYNCSSLANVTLSKNLKTLGTGVFGNCVELTSIEIPKSLEHATGGLSDNRGPFVDCIKLKNINFEEGTTEIVRCLFAGCTGLEKIVIPDTVTTIGDYAFASCSNLENITIPDNVTVIRKAAFYNCSSLANVILSKKLKTIEDAAFGSCGELTSIEIPKSLEHATGGLSDNRGPFVDCIKLKNINFEEGTTKIVRCLFAGCTGLEKIVIPDTVTTIGDYAFASCSNLENITIPNSVTTIGNNLFYNNTALTTVMFSNAIKIIPKNTFYGCSSLTSITIPDNITIIDNSAFYNCNSLSQIQLSKNLKTIGALVFYDCNALTDIIIPNSVESIGNSCFANCEKLKNIHLGTGLTTIPEGCFSDCPSLEELVIPYRVIKINNYTFKNCTKLSAITLPRGLISINGTEVFSYPEKLTVYGINGTYAQQYANNNHIKFVHKEIKTENVKLLPNTITINNGQSATLVMSVEPVNFTDEVTWKSSNINVVTVSDTGIVKAVGSGTAVIKVTVGDKSDSCTVTVVQPVTSISFNQRTLNMESSQTYQLQTYVYPQTALNKQLTWSSDNEAVAKVDENGLVTAIAKGTAKITATAQDGSNVSGICIVNVTNNVYQITDVEKLESPHNYELNCNDVWIYSVDGAKTLAVTFDEKTNIEENFDYLYIYDSADKLVGKYTGTVLSGVTVNITGDTIKLKLVSDNVGTEWGFRVKCVEADIANEEVKAEGVTISFKEVTLNIGQTKSLTATVIPINCTQKMLWESSDINVATVSDTGTVSAVGAGTAVIKVTVGDKSDSCTVMVTESIKIKYGDVNGDGDINVSDAVCLKKYLAGMTEIKIDKSAADVNADGDINIRDTVILLKHLAGMNVELGKK